MKMLRFLLILIFPFCFIAVLFADEEPITTRKEEVKGFTMTLADDNGREKAVINGSVANILPGGLIEVIDVVARVYNPDNKTTEALIHSCEAIYNRFLNIVDTDKFVRINRRDMVITGTGLHWNGNVSKVEIQKNVRVEYINRRTDMPGGGLVSVNGKTEESALSPSSAEKDFLTVITSEGPAKLNYKDEMTSTFKKDVEVTDKDTKLNAKFMKVYFDKDTEAITKVEAFGNVKITQLKRTSYSQKAVYYADMDKVILTGKPRIVQGLDLYSAKKISIYDKGERVVFEPKAEMIIYTKSEEE